MTITEIKEANKAAGFHFFERDTVRFFRSKICSEVYDGPRYSFFVTSEIGPDEIQRYTVRRYNHETHNVGTEGPFHKYERKRGAIEAAKRARGASYAQL